MKSLLSLIFIVGIVIAIRRKSRIPRITLPRRVKHVTVFSPSYYEEDSIEELEELDDLLDPVVIDPKKELEIEQAKEDYAYIQQQLKRYEKLIEEANVNLFKAQKSVDLDIWFEEHGTPVAEKESKKHRTERDRQVKAVIRLENQIHAAEKKLRKVELILKAAE